ncbi:MULTISPECIES: VanZ family protein [Cohnella]|uniref:VanZ family protein n=1 Tax=Cohnella TaxID=329857 RepID=UPI0009B9926E|nr:MULTISPECIES: VanZ family protein [Cohnella]MBN2980248.1 VanZ family protein [Cohnella algarum]
MRVKVVICLAFVAAWIGVIFFFSSQSRDEQNFIPYLQKHWSAESLSRSLPDLPIEFWESKRTSAGNPYSWLEFLVRKAAHLGIYFFLAVLVRLALRRVRSFPQRAVYCLFAVMLVAAADELNQQYTPGRTSLVSDIWIDLAGGALGLAVFEMLARWFGPKGGLARERRSGPDSRHTGA